MPTYKIEDNTLIETKEIETRFDENSLLDERKMAENVITNAEKEIIRIDALLAEIAKLKK